jgi:type IV pilus assembly protein PilM
LSSAPGIRSALSGLPLVGRVVRWLDALPHPLLACEVGAGYVAAVRSSRAGPGIEGFAIENLLEGAVAPSPVELNVVNADAVREVLQRTLSRVGGGPELALLLPDQVVRVFLLHFDTFPRYAEEAVPLLRWRLKKSVPFDVEDTVVSYTVQPARGEGVDVLAAVARQRIIRQYEELVEAAGFHPGVVVSSTLASLPLLEQGRTTLLARMTERILTAVIARGDRLCVYRCTEMPVDAAALEPQALLDEVYPAVAFCQDNWGESVEQVRLAGFGTRFQELRTVLEGELNCSAAPLAASSRLESRVASAARQLLDRQLESLVGWILNRGA